MRTLATSLLVFCLLSVRAFAGEAELFPIPYKGNRDRDRGHLYREIGLLAGEPALLNVTYGFWGTPSMPFLARVAGGYYGKNAKGIELELGWAFDQRGPIRQYIAMGYGTGHLEWGGSALTWEGAGPVYGLRIYGIAASVGWFIGHGEHYADPRGPIEAVRQKILVEFGYTFHW